jgi:hypothetical protein
VKRKWQAHNRLYDLARRTSLSVVASLQRDIGVIVQGRWDDERNSDTTESEEPEHARESVAQTEREAEQKNGAYEELDLATVSERDQAMLAPQTVTRIATEIGGSKHLALNDDCGGRNRTIPDLALSKDVARTVDGIGNG